MRFRCLFAFSVLQLALSSSARAVPPPPMPFWFKDAIDNIVEVKQVIGGSWMSVATSLSAYQVMRIGTFGDTSPNYVLVERTYAEGGHEFHRLSALFFSAGCQRYEMLSINKLADIRAPETTDCTRSFPIDFHPDGSLSFEYTDWNSDRVKVSVNKSTWHETRDVPGVPYVREVYLTKAARPAVWGDVH